MLAAANDYQREDGWHEARVQFDDGESAGFDRTDQRQRRRASSHIVLFMVKPVKLFGVDRTLVIEHHFAPMNIEAVNDR